GRWVAQRDKAGCACAEAPGYRYLLRATAQDGDPARDRRGRAASWGARTFSFSPATTWGGTWAATGTRRSTPRRLTRWPGRACGWWISHGVRRTVGTRGRGWT